MSGTIGSRTGPQLERGGPDASIKLADGSSPGFGVLPTFPKQVLQVCPNAAQPAHAEGRSRGCSGAAVVVEALQKVGSQQSAGLDLPEGNALSAGKRSKRGRGNEDWVCRGRKVSLALLFSSGDIFCRILDRG